MNERTCKDCCCFAYIEIEGPEGRCDFHNVFIPESDTPCSEYDRLNGLLDE